ncbi:hypothetical protein [Marilutibacter alkalisoli]|uniref:FliM/FliN family flagellar motor switch protein n=1 Tax=Marilutibacter alkalisoli TaxID=2591633 RepID=A0A514BSY8_9GAMM|nr:hypothetical protein [Lysobacter alkalisoli]QDH70139.1 hypothetical protein FKV23_08560 [Lysobacter alkalisoli]
MNVVALRWQGASRIERLRSLVEERARQWWGEWALDQSRVPAVTVSGDRPLVRDGGEWYGIDGSSGRLFLQLPSHAFERLGCLLLGLPEPDSAGIAFGVGRRAISAAVRVLAGAQDEPRHLDHAPAPFFYAARHGAVSMTWKMDTIDLGVHLDDAMCRSLVPVTGHVAPALASRRTAILHEEVSLPVMLDLGRAGLAETLSLRPGEIVKSDVRLGAMVRVVADNGTVVLAGQLAADGDHRAIRCMGAQNQQE